jgi:hypothetical protein
MPDIPARDALHDTCTAPGPCPICSAMNCGGCRTFCRHWLGSTEFGACTTLAEEVPDFTDAVGQLVGLVEAWGPPRIARLMGRHRAPPPLGPVIWAALDEREYWLTAYRDLRLRCWVRHGRPAREGCECFHPWPHAFARQVRDDAAQARRWLVAQRRPRRGQTKAGPTRMRRRMR